MEITIQQKSPIADFVSTLLASRTQAHIFHWQTQGGGSLAAHLALGEYYDEIVDLVDDLVESYQGKNGIIKGYTGIPSLREDGSFKVYFEALSRYVEQKRHSVTQDTYIQNQIDEIVALIETTKYKLNNLM